MQKDIFKNEIMEIICNRSTRRTNKKHTDTLTAFVSNRNVTCEVWYSHNFCFCIKGFTLAYNNFVNFITALSVDLSRWKW